MVSLSKEDSDSHPIQQMRTLQIKGLIWISNSRLEEPGIRSEDSSFSLKGISRY